MDRWRQSSLLSLFLMRAATWLLNPSALLGSRRRTAQDTSALAPGWALQRLLDCSAGFSKRIWAPNWPVLDLVANGWPVLLQIKHVAGKTRQWLYY